MGRKVQIKGIKIEDLEYFAKYIWWEKADYLIANDPYRIIAGAMRDANQIEPFIRLKKSFNKDVLRETLKRAQPGWLDAKSWSFWHYLLYGKNATIPPLPKRSIEQ